jgi:hypothetical protein
VQHLGRCAAGRRAAPPITAVITLAAFPCYRRHEVIPPCVGFEHACVTAKVLIQTTTQSTSVRRAH